jgi:protein-S-isoprenylcysteine O-methyltransferase Ste14
VLRFVLIALNLVVGSLLIGLVWGRFPDFFRDPVRDLALLIAFVPSLALLGTSGAGRGVKHSGEGSYLVIANTMWNVTLLAMIYLRGHRLALLPGDRVPRVAGLVVLAAGAFVRSAAMVQLGRRFSLHVALQDQHTLHTSGLYARIRHPSYLGLLLLMLGLALVFESQLGIWAVVVAGFMMRGRMNREEAFLLQQFGDEYRAYMTRTKRILPGVY